MIPERFLATCYFCGMPIDSSAKGIHQWISGWVEKRSAGGAHAVSGMMREQRFAHGPCVRAAAPEHNEQLALW